MPSGDAPSGKFGRQRPKSMARMVAAPVSARPRQRRAPGRRTVARPQAPTAELTIGQADDAPPPHPGRPTGTCPHRRNGRTSPGCCAPPSSAAPCRRGSRSRDPSRSGSKRPTPGTTPGSPGNATVRQRASRRPARPRGCRNSRANAARSAERPVEPLGRPSDQRRVRSSRAARATAREGPVSNGPPARSATSAPRRSIPAFE